MAATYTFDYSKLDENKVTMHCEGDDLDYGVLTLMNTILYTWPDCLARLLLIFLYHIAITMANIRMPMNLNGNWMKTTVLQNVLLDMKRIGIIG